LRTARRTGGGEQRQEEEGQPEAAGRAIHNPGCYYGFVYMSMLALEPSQGRIGAIIHRLRPP
jgi:hypothetical protein